MARPLRIEHPGACYHVICRGNLRYPVFRDEQDCRLFLDRLVKYGEVFRVRIRAYCVMANHVHLYVQTEEANLGRFMQSLLTAFTLSHNRRHDTAGHVFQGRYKAFLVEDGDAYASRVSRYIHLNPARIPSLEDASVEARQRAIRQCPWSSYGAVIGLRPCPEWLCRDDVLRAWEGTLREKQAEYARYVEQGLTKDLWDPWEAAAAQAIIGSDSFVDRVRRSVSQVAHDVNARAQSSQRRRLDAWCTPAQVRAAVTAAYRCDEQDVLRPHSRGNEARQVLLYLTATCCRGRHSLSELGLQLGPITVAALSRARARMAARLRESKSLRSRVSAIEAGLLPQGS
ncbi:MAG: Transposase IS200 like protein [Lentisphaerae bacterium ADurb.BinA184]|nr:MAG: Transposase IS200 like protein [Lentisphaerae bacterium ADurb.BinA184]